jgi:hypothetical protein
MKMKITDEEFMREAQSHIDQPWKWTTGASSRYLGYQEDTGQPVIAYCMTGALHLIHRQQRDLDQFHRAMTVLANVIYDETGKNGIANFNDNYATHDQVMAMMEKSAAKLAEKNGHDESDS